MKTFTDVINKWSDVDELASDLGIKPNTVRMWKDRDQIPQKKLEAVRVAAKKRKINGVTAKLLLLISAN